MGLLNHPFYMFCLLLKSHFERELTRSMESVREDDLLGKKKKERTSVYRI
jgi:hypothetical protein